MKTNATHARRAFLAVLTTAFVVLCSAPAHAQVDPTWDHYKAYQALPHIPFPVQVTLVDQFQTTTHLTQYLDWFANPVEKRHGPAVFPINHPELHYAWWQLGPEVPFVKDLVASNQFGDQFIRLERLAYLLNPALKNAPTGTPLPIANHYKCYLCAGNSVNAPVFLTDQFFGRAAIVLQPRFFCTPTEKRTPDGLVHPIIDPDQHYTVYDMDYTTQPWPAFFRDQFTQGTIDMQIDRLLMVPTNKVIPTDAAPTTWGRLKSQYR